MDNSTFKKRHVSTIVHFKGETLRSRHRIFVDFDKIYVFCGKCCVHIDTCVFIVVKIKCENYDRICTICDKVKSMFGTHFCKIVFMFVKQNL